MSKASLRPTAKRGSTDVTAPMGLVKANAELKRGSMDNLPPLSSTSTVFTNGSSDVENPLRPDPREQIRKILVPAIIEQASEMKLLVKILRESGEELIFFVDPTTCLSIWQKFCLEGY